MNALVLVCLAGLVLGAVLLEGWTIVRCATSWGGRRPLGPVGWTFLFTEVWVIALLGFWHATYPVAAHHVLAAAWVPLSAYGLAWMVRDAGLWQVALRRRNRWMPVVAGAALAQLGCAVWAGIALVGARHGIPSAPHPSSSTTTAIVGIVGSGCVILVAGLQGWWLLRLRPRVARQSG